MRAPTAIPTSVSVNEDECRGCACECENWRYSDSSDSVVKGRFPVCTVRGTDRCQRSSPSTDNPGAVLVDYWYGAAAAASLRLRGSGLKRRLGDG